MPSDAVGTLAYRNWNAAQKKGASSESGAEYPCFTDAHIVGEIIKGLGPYQLLNTIAGDAEAQIPSVVLRIQYHLGNDPDGWFGEGDEQYHGGYVSDEIAALIALSLGIRFKAGGATRVFYHDGDPMGNPVVQWDPWQSDPVFIKSRKSLILPNMLGKRDLMDADLLRHFYELSPNEAVVLMRSARLYQDAVWIAESEPQLSWLMLVSAVESAAAHWRSENEMPVERLRISMPNLETILLKAGGIDLVTKVASDVAPYMGSTKKFIDFLLSFGPPAPKKRPSEWCQIEWNDKSLKRMFSKIYDRRSRALHGGKPFPYPMCIPPRKDGENYSEHPLVTGAMGAQWNQDEAPMLLQTFEYIVRAALLNWWKGLVENKQRVLIK